jgi:ABC-type glycerol-3-phosphate transport system permease component
VIWAISTSLKIEEEILKYPPQWIPDPLNFAGYEYVISQSSSYTKYMVNTLIYAVTSTSVAVVLSSLAGYAVSRFRFPGRRLVLGTTLFSIMIPGLTQTIPLYSMFSDADLLNSYIGLIIIYSAYSLPFSIWIMKSFFDTIPKEMEEAALIDGCNVLQTLVLVIAPISVPGVMTIALLNFVAVWKEFFINLIFTTGDQLRNVNVGLYSFLGLQYGIQYHRLMSTAILIMVPVILLFLLGRRYFMRTMLEGALKGV